ncbi:hypothetical protein CH63R_12460 [Colletotrichum higginsianum IMI 349063]|uniref:Uncharacterized protein n=1 Tax=Colletotrichum higginsianum (strain IMI 349063) TaxID=759273 RepID=A0A1B7XUA1_COLHI|nr:hypothetical protein CH63R_12460 [Colletotrichum higginsianum IMI 349063]OBR03333.1 hypothetical protein CH63R_12460 [Colletotrichum higginsianum IMI 349063]
MFKGRPSTDPDDMPSQPSPPPPPPPPTTAAPPPPPPPSGDLTPDADTPPSQSSYGYSSQSTMGQEPEIVEAHDEERPTDSHHLADMAAKEKPLEEKGHAELDHADVEVKNLGWNNPPSKVSQPMIGGLTNEDLWILVRRFDKLANLDMNIADEEEFSPDKLRAHVERLYMTVIVGLFAFWKHIVRLRSWREWRRTSVFLAVYSAAWLLDFVVPVLVAFLVVLVLVPDARTFCFPPAPPSLIDGRTGGVKKPSSGVLASDDSITGAPEKHAGEAVEQEAHSFVNSISSLIVSTAAGKHPQGDPHDDTAAPDPTNMAQDIVNAKDKTGGDEPSVHHDKTKKPVHESVWVKARPVMHSIADVVDTWERFGNALSPTPPFPQQRPRLILASLLLPMLLGSLFTTSYMLVKGTGFVVGFTIFGDPVIQRGLVFINRTYPHWKKYVELRNTVLKGIPTNAQLTITLLRIGERNKAPLPPPPVSSEPPPDVPHATAGEGLEHLGVDQDEIDEAVQPDPNALAPAESQTEEHKQKKGHRILNFIKSTAKGGINTTLAADKVKAKVGAKHAKDRLGVVKTGPDPEKGPISFPARWKGKKGRAFITATATTPALSWTTDSDDLNPTWTVSVGDIAQIRKMGGLGWKSKIFVGWATDREIADGLIVTDTMGKEHHLTAIISRDELFNRLVAIGSQMWEAW